MQNATPESLVISVTTRLDRGLHEWLEERARRNKRSISGEAAMILEERRTSDAMSVKVVEKGKK